MKIRALIFILLISIGYHANAQTLSEPMETAVEICKNLSNAIRTSSTAALKAENNRLKTADIIEFNALRLESGEEINLNGHFLFDEVFIDSLIQNRKIIEFASIYAKKRSTRSSSGVNGRILLTTKGIKAGKSTVWKTVNRGYAEYATIAEPEGLFTMTIRDKEGKTLYVETHNNKKGDTIRKAKMDLPTGKMTILFIEITNHGKKDASFAILSN